MKKSYFISPVFLLLYAFSFLISCKEPKRTEPAKMSKSEVAGLVKYARGFDIQYRDKYKVLVIKSPYPESDQAFKINLYNPSEKIELPGKNLAVPLNKVVVTSTTHIPMLEILGLHDKLVGFPNTAYISSEEIVERVENGQITDLGNPQDFNTEILINLRPDAVIAFSMVNNSKLYKSIEKINIPVIYNGDWLEETPLGRAEWIKFFGVLFNKEKEADSIFGEIERAYLNAKKLALQAENSPRVLSGVLYKDQWNLPAGESFTARLYKDANTDYIWKNSKGQGSLVLSFEAVFDQAKDADLWIGSGYYTSFPELVSANQHYAQFKAFNTKNVYSFSKRRGKNGGVEYFELGPLQPHVVLKDLIKVAHPELLPGYEPYFLQRLDE